MKLFTEELVAQAARVNHVSDLSHATIGETLLVAQYLESKTGIPFIRMDQGSPGLPANHYGIEAEKKALDSGIASQYPPAAGVDELKEAASCFVKAFIDIDISPRGCIPTVGSVAGSFSSFIACSQRDPKRNKILFIDPGFPIQKSQLLLLGIEWRAFDIYNYRGKALRARLEEEFKDNDIAAIVYSNPNNPAWISLEEEELEIIGQLATEHDAIVIEDLAYFAMESRRDLSHPYEAPFVRTVARYTDNYMLLLSASKIFSYAGQRIALVCVGDRLFDRHFPALAERYHSSGVFGPTLIASILYMITSGATITTQHAYAVMLRLSCEGCINFVEDTRPYAEHAAKMKEIFRRHGFTITYPSDVSEEIGDGFFFSLSYPGLSGSQLAVELIHYGVSSINLDTTGSLRPGVRACTSRMRDELYPLLDERMAQFHKDHPTD